MGAAGNTYHVKVEPFLGYGSDIGRTGMSCNYIFCGIISYKSENLYPFVDNNYDRLLVKDFMHES